MRINPTLLPTSWGRIGLHSLHLTVPGLPPESYGDYAFVQHMIASMAHLVLDPFSGRYSGKKVGEVYCVETIGVPSPSCLKNVYVPQSIHTAKTGHRLWHATGVLC